MGKDFFCVLFLFMFQSFSKNMFNSLKLSLSGKKFDFGLLESSVFSLLFNFSSNLNFCSNSSRSPFNSLSLLLGERQYFRPTFN